MKSDETTSIHIPVLRDEVVEVLRAKEGGDFVDCTLGGGGHSEAILNANEKNTVLAFDRDLPAIKRAEKKLETFGKRFRAVHGSFGGIESHAAAKNYSGVLIDLGISTDQLKGERGFSFNDSDSLDMRMDQSQSLSANEVVNNYDERELLKVFKKGGVGQEAYTITKSIIHARPIETAKQLSATINQALGSRAKKTKINPSTVAFQAIRIEVNNEFEEIEKALKAAPKILKDGGRLAIITFHSLEDKLVARTMRDWEQSGTEPANWRGERGQAIGRTVVKKAILPSEEEISRNSASRSAKLRVFEFIKEGKSVWQ